ncbi:MAG: low molecular weight protein-tyrosine-phosphatase [Candidatus Planktophila sp.]
MYVIFGYGHLVQNQYIEKLRSQDLIRVEMVCLGNICRSPMAAAVLHNKTRGISQPRFEVTSSGTSGWHDGEDAHHLSRKTWEAAGYTYSHTSRKFQRSFFDEVDLILPMDLTNRANILNGARTDADRAKVVMLRSFDLELAHIDPTSPEAERLQVPDPWGETIEAYREVLEMIELATDGLLKVLLLK